MLNLMNQRAYTALLALALSAPASGALIGPEEDGAIIGPGHRPVSVTAGETFDLTVFLEGVEDLFAFQFGVSFDPSVLQSTAVTEGPLLGSGGPTLFIPGFADNITGTIDLIAGTLLGPFPGVSGDGDLATLSFDVLQSTDTEVRWTDVVLLDSNEREIPIKHAPEPGTAAALGLGLLGLAARARNRRPGA